MPEGTLTAAQYEILEVVHHYGKSGATVAEIWQQVTTGREVTRTTILNLVNRLEKRGWLKRLESQGANRFQAVMSQKKTATFLAREFTDEFFGGSASHLMMSLLGSKRLNADEVASLQKLLTNQIDKKTKGDK